MSDTDLINMQKKRGLRENDNLRLFLTALLAIALSLLVAVFVMWATGVEPRNFFKALLRTYTGLDPAKAGTDQFFRPRYLGEFLQMSLPLILTGLALGFGQQCGLFNIGAEGQVIAGMLGANLVAILIPIQNRSLAVLAVIAAGLFGALWALIPGLLKAYMGISEVVTTIMFNYIIFYLSNAVLKSLPGSNPQRTVDLPENAMLSSDWLREITGNSRLHWGIVVVAAAIICYNLILNHTSFGYEIKACGSNRDAAAYAGIKVRSRIVYSMMISGLFAGLAGACLALGTFRYGRILQGFENYGFDGIAVGLLGGTKGVGILLAGLLMGGLRSGQPLMQAERVPLEIAQIVSALIVLFVAMQKGVEILGDYMARKRMSEKLAESKSSQASEEGGK
jgi:ABC-type uncharacterized transport system permease subunit